MSSNFYTNVQLIGNQFLIRGVEDGKRYETKRNFSPTLFIPTKKQSKYKTLNGETTTDLSYILSTLKKFGSIHRLPYSWILKYGSIWNRYKTCLYEKRTRHS